MWTNKVSAGEIYLAEPSTVSKKGSQITNRLKTVTQKVTGQPIEVLSSKAAGALSGDSSIVISIGSESLIEILSGPGNSPVIAAFVNKRTFKKIMSTHHSNERKITAIYSEPDPRKQVALIKVLHGETASASIVQSDNIKEYISEYHQASTEFNVQLRTISLLDINSSSDFINLTKGTKSLILLKDHALFDQVALDQVLLSSYDINFQGVIGYSKGLVNNGAAATTYSSLDNIAESISQQINNIEITGILDSPHYTKNFNLSLNKYVLRSLDAIDVENESVRSKLMALISKDVIQ